jgi:hypothetical protein
MEAYSKYPPSVTLWEGMHSKRSALLHELNHNIQSIEDFPLGGNPGMFAGDVINPLWVKRKADVARFDALHASPEYAADTARSNAYYESSGLSAKHDEIMDSFMDKKLSRKEYESEMAKVDREFKNWVKSEAKTMHEADRLWAETLNPLGPRTLTPQMQYKHLVGEADARAVQDRRDWSMADRIATPFWESYDVPEGAMTRIYQAKEPKGLLND